MDQPQNVSILFHIHPLESVNLVSIIPLLFPSSISLPLLSHNLVQISYLAATSILQCSAASIRKVAVKKVIEVFVRMTLFLLVQNQCSEEEQEKYKPRLWSILNAHLSIEPNEYASLNDNSRDHYDWSYYNG